MSDSFSSRRTSSSACVSFAWRLRRMLNCVDCRVGSIVFFYSSFGLRVTSSSIGVQSWFISVPISSSIFACPRYRVSVSSRKFQSSIQISWISLRSGGSESLLKSSFSSWLTDSNYSASFCNLSIRLCSFDTCLFEVSSFVFHSASRSCDRWSYSAPCAIAASLACCFA